MSLLLTLAILLAQDPTAVPELSGNVRSEAYDFEIGLPKGWQPTRTLGATFFRVLAPAGTVADGAAWLAHHDSNHPVTLPYLTDVFRRKAATDYPGFKGISEKTLSAAGFPAHQIVFSATGKGGKELVFVHTVIQRQLQEYFILDVVAAVREKDRIAGLAERLLASFRSGLPVPKDKEDRLARTAALLKGAAARPNLAGTFWHEIIVGERKLGWQRYDLREGKIDGAAGWEFEVECLQEDSEGGKRTDLSRGAFTADGSIQRVEVRRLVQTPKDPPVDVRESASIVRGSFKASREFLEQKVDKEFKVPEGTVLGDVAETMRRLIALAPPGKNALRVLEPFRDLAVIEEWQNEGPSRIRVDGEDRDLVQLLVTYPRQDPAQYLYDLDGSLRRRKGSGGIMILKRSTEQEARKR